MSDTPKIICISNRLPVNAVEEENSVRFQPSSGGLVTAMAPILSASCGVWVGWPGKVKSQEAEVHQALAELSRESKFELFAVMLDQVSIDNFYFGFSNQIIWPLFHDLQSRCNFEPEFWAAYQSVQEQYANGVAGRVGPDDLIWVHDYHLMGLGRELRKNGLKNKLCFFLHTPFPGPDIFLKLPWRQDVVDSLLSYQLIGFQTKRDSNNFLQCVEYLTEYRAVKSGLHSSIAVGQQSCLVGHFPISIDFAEFESLASLSDVEANAQKIRSDMGTDFLILGIDRLDYTKGITYRIKAFKRLLELEPSLKRKIALLQVVVPSRIEIPEYQTLKQEIEQLVSQVNGEFGEPGWMPVHHLFRSLSREEVISMYRASCVALVTPFKDGMNLVAKEYCTSQVDNSGALVMSEFAGCADEFKDHCFLVNPYDIEDVAKKLGAALLTPIEERQQRMAAMRQVVQEKDVYHWARNFLGAANWQWPTTESLPQPQPTIWERLRRISGVFDI